MKKLLSFCALFALCHAHAQTTFQNVQNQPALLLDVYDLSDPKNPKALSNRTLSRSNPNHRLCWTTVNVNTRETNFTIEQFVSPIGARFIDHTGTEAQRDKAGKLHTLISNISAQDNQSVGKCWKFSNKYPTGQYTFAARINEIEFPIQTFTIGK